jgi:hypothetical protein
MVACAAPPADDVGVELRRAVRVVAGGDALLTPAVTKRVIEAAASAPRYRMAAARLDGLTGGEREVLYKSGSASPTPRSPRPC